MCLESNGGGSKPKVSGVGLMAFKCFFVVLHGFQPSRHLVGDEKTTLW